MIQPFDDIELIIKHIETTGEVSIWSKESMFSEFVQIVDFNGIVFVIFCGS